MRLLVVLGLLLLVAAVSCGGDDDARPSSTPAPTPDSQGYVPIEWEEAVALFKVCQVDWALQSHRRDVYIIMDDGRKFRSREFELGDVFDVVDALPAGCGPATLGLE